MLDKSASEESDEKQPFYYRFPWVILTNPVETRKIKPLEVNLADILPSFLVKMQEDGLVDLTVSGRALYSASIILRIQTDLVIKLIQVLDQPEEEQSITTYPPLQIPYRLSAKRITIDELLISLSKVLAETSLRKKKSKTVTKKSELILPLDLEPDRINIDTLIEKIYMRIMQISSIQDGVSFRDLLTSESRIEIVRVFLCLLYLLNRSKIDVVQDPETGVITIAIL